MPTLLSTAVPDTKNTAPCLVEALGIKLGEPRLTLCTLQFRCVRSSLLILCTLRTVLATALPLLKLPLGGLLWMLASSSQQELQHARYNYSQQH